MPFLLNKHIIHLRRVQLALLLALVLGAGACRPNVKDVSAPDKKRITSDVWLHRTSAHVVSVTDKEGMGLVYGNIERIGYTNGRNVLRVVYQPFSAASQTNAANAGSLKVADIDLKTLTVSDVPDPNGDIAKSLGSIGSFFP